MQVLSPSSPFSARPLIRRLRRQRHHPLYGDQGRLVHRRFGRQRHAHLSWPALSAEDRGHKRGPRLRRVENDAVGPVSHIRRPSDVAGVYGAAGAGAAVGSGPRAIVLTNEKGAVLRLQGRQVGLMFNADLSGLAITLK